MEYLPGRSLKQLIRQEAPLDPLRAIDITIQILKAARFAHRRGVIHRDLKPHNVIVDDSDHAKVTDFGIARAGRLGHDRDRLDHGHRAVPVARAGPGPRRQRGLRPVLDRRRALRDAHRPRSVRRRLRGHDRAQARLRGAGAAELRSTPTSRPSSSRSCCGCSTRTPPTVRPTPISSSPCSSTAARRSPRPTPASTPPAWPRWPPRAAAAGAGAAIGAHGLAAYQQAQAQATNGSGEMSAVRPPEEDEGPRLDPVGVARARPAADRRSRRRRLLPDPPQAGPGAQGHRRAGHHGARHRRAGQVPGGDGVGAEPQAVGHRGIASPRRPAPRPTRARR